MAEEADQAGRPVAPDPGKLKDQVLVELDALLGGDWPAGVLVPEEADVDRRSTAVEQYARAAVHLAGLAAIAGGASLAGKAGGYEKAAVARAVWETASKIEGFDADGITADVLAHLEGKVE